MRSSTFSRCCKHNLVIILLGLRTHSWHTSVNRWMDGWQLCCCNDVRTYSEIHTRCCTPSLLHNHSTPSSTTELNLQYSNATRVCLSIILLGRWISRFRSQHQTLLSPALHTIGNEAHATRAYIMLLGLEYLLLHTISLS